MSRAQFQADLARLTHRTAYLELGLYDASTFLTVSQHVNRAVGVDVNHIDIQLPTHCFIYETTTDNFFKDNQEIFDYIFIDADHSYMSVKKDLENSLKYLSEDGIILLHDTDPISKEYLAPGYCNDAYKIIDDIYKQNDLDIITLPLEEAGITILRKHNQRRVRLVV